MKKRTLTVLVVALVCTFLTACINMYYDQELSFKKAFSCVGKTSIYCAMYQILDGNPDYSIYLNIYNVDTGKLVVGGNLMNEEVSYTDEDWEKTF